MFVINDQMGVPNDNQLIIGRRVLSQRSAICHHFSYFLTYLSYFSFVCCLHGQLCYFCKACVVFLDVFHV